MPMLYKVVAPLGNYTDADGNEKTRWMNCGSILKTSTGRVVLKIDALPVNPVGAGGDDGGEGYLPVSQDGKFNYSFIYLLVNQIFSTRRE